MSLPKYISGVSGYVETGLGIAITYATDFGYDKVCHVEDITAGSLETPTTTQGHDSFTLFYSNLQSDLTSRRLEIVFESGYTKILEVFAPPRSKAVSIPVLSLEAFVRGQSDLGNFEQKVFGGPDNKFKAGAYAMLPVTDPYNKFGYDSSWGYNEDGVAFSFNGSQISSLDTSIARLGVPEMKPAEQFAQYVCLLGRAEEFNSASDVWSAALDSSDISPTAFAFVWSRDLPEFPEGEVKRFDVCGDPRSTSYYRTTGQDAAGTTIPSEYLENRKPAMFVPGVCGVDPSPFKINIEVTRPNIVDDGEIKITVLGNTASPSIDPWTDRNAYAQDKRPTYPDITGLNFNFKITDPVTRTTTATGSKASNTHTFTGISAEERPYTIEVIDVATSITATVSTQVRNDSDRNCICEIGTAVNFYGGAATGLDKCDICIECPSVNQVTVGGLLQPNGFFEEVTSTVTNASAAGTSDGELSVAYGIPNTLQSDVLPYLTAGTYKIVLQTTTGPGGASTGTVTTLTAEPAPSAIFTPLAPGWYLVSISSVDFGSCRSTFYYEVPYDVAEEDCSFTQSLTIDPCTGLLSDVSIESNYSYSEVEHFVDGLSVTLPVTVNVNQTISTVVTYNDPNVDCEKETQQYVVQEADRNCTELDATPGVGCTDPTALNYDPSATVDSGMCQYGISGCMDPSATNYNPEATVQGTEPNPCIYLCTFSPISAITVSGSIPTMTFFAGQDPVVYSVTWYSFSDGSTTVVENSGIGPSLADGAYLVTLETSLGCVFSEIFGINTDIVAGCMDINAENYQPSANVPYNANAEYPDLYTIVSQECEYNLEQSGCVPSTLLNTINGLTRCIARKSEVYVNAMKAGRLSDCLINDLRILTLIRYIFRQRGLECVFNCKDGQTPDTVAVSCASKWEAGGPTGSSLMYSGTQSYTWGDVVKMPVSGNIYICTAINGLIPGFSPEEPFNTQFWDVCTDVVDPTGSINRIDPYLEKAKNICTDCGINIDIPEIEESSEITEEGSSMGGTTLTISGAPVNLN